MHKRSSQSLQEAPLSSCVCLGVIGAPHGIHGAVKIKTFTENSNNLTSYGPLRDAMGCLFSLKIITELTQDMVIAQIEGITTRTQAEELRGRHLYVARSSLPHTSEDEFYHSDLIGLRVVTTTDQVIGVIKAVNNYGAGDFLEILSKDGHLLTIPFRQEAVTHVDLTLKQITVLEDFILSNK
jgi:16S rRNA processing protein RimM